MSSHSALSVCPEVAGETRVDVIVPSTHSGVEKICNMWLPSLSGATGYQDSEVGQSGAQKPRSRLPSRLLDNRCILCAQVMLREQRMGTPPCALGNTQKGYKARLTHLPGATGDQAPQGC